MEIFVFPKKENQGRDQSSNLMQVTCSMGARTFRFATLSSVNEAENAQCKQSGKLALLICQKALKVSLD